MEDVFGAEYLERESEEARAYWGAGKDCYIMNGDFVCYNPNRGWVIM